MDTTTTRPHCTKCGAYLDRAPDNAFGWCGACQAWAQMGGMRRAPAQPMIPDAPTVPPEPAWWSPYSWRYTCTGPDTPGAWTYTWPLQVPGFSGTITQTLHAPHC
jgi:hypothetical protein